MTSEQYSSQHQKIKYSCCNTSQFKHLQGLSDLNSRAVFSGVDMFKKRKLGKMAGLSLNISHL